MELWKAFWATLFAKQHGTGAYDTLVVNSSSERAFSRMMEGMAHEVVSIISMNAYEQ